MWGLWLATLPVSAQYFGFKINSGKKSVKLSYEIYNNLVVIPALLNGKIPIRLVMDSGVRSTILTDRFITDMLRLPYNRKISINGPGDYIMLEAHVVSQLNIHLEGVTGYDQTILVLEKDYLHLRNYLGIEVHGMIGYDIFNRFVIGFDYPNKKMVFIEPRKFVPPKKKYVEMPLVLEDTKPYITAHVVVGDTTRIPVKLMIDTGASHSLLLNENSDPRISIPEKNMDTEIGRGLGGNIHGKLARIQELDIGGFRFENVVASFPDPVDYPDTLTFSERNGTLGSEILSRFMVYFDYRHGKIYLKKNQNFRKEFGYNMSGLTIITEGDKLETFKIAEVRQPSEAAEAGLLAGDEVISINGFKVEDMKLNGIYQLFNYRAGKPITMFVRRDGKVLKKKFLLQDYL
jgi:hypothetical protein